MEISVKDILGLLTLEEELKILLQRLVLSHRGSVEVIIPKEGGKENPVFKDLVSLEDNIWMINGIVLVDLKSFNVLGSTDTRSVNVVVDCWGHLGIPDGETSKFLGRCSMTMEEIAFILMLINAR